MRATKPFQSRLLAVELFTSKISAGCIGKPVTIQHGRSVANKPSYRVFRTLSLEGSLCSKEESVTTDKTQVRTSSLSSYLTILIVIMVIFSNVNFLS